MKLTAFQSDKGDCLLLESADGKNRMLIDGGMKRAYSEQVAPAMGGLRKAKKKLDVVYISHIDEDHISGVLQMLDDEAAWRVHEHQVKNGNSDHPEPDAPRPPEVGKIFHNSFHDQVGKNSGEIQDMLAATATILSGSEHPWLREVVEKRQNLVTSIPQAMKVSQRIKPGQLNIPLNPQFAGKLMMVKEGTPQIKLGSINLKVIGPFPEDLRNLQKDWNAWLKKNQENVKTIRAQAKRDENSMSAGEVDRLLGPLLSASEQLGAMELALAKKLGNRKKVTAPNLASLMFLAEEKGKRILLTGDGHADDIVKGLEHQKTFDANGRLHVEVLKVQHHGSEHNIHQQFCDRVTADHYVFCGNGEHENPELDVLQLVFDRRMANDKKAFKFWFNSTSKLSVTTAGREQMKEVEDLAAKLAGKSKGRLTNQFIKVSSIRIM
jgi:beta-lactamase superfamily II metal-dependent hydrolase